MQWKLALPEDWQPRPVLLYCCIRWSWRGAVQPTPILMGRQASGLHEDLPHLASTASAGRDSGAEGHLWEGRHYSHCCCCCCQCTWQKRGTGSGRKNGLLDSCSLQRAAAEQSLLPQEPSTPNWLARGCK